MKGFVLFLLVSSAAWADGKYAYTCHGHTWRDKAGESPVVSRLRIVERREWGLRVIQVAGVLAGEEFEPIYLEEDPDYKPTSYRDHSKFPDFESGPMIGYLVIEKDIADKESFSAHYVFRFKGRGATIDLACTKSVLP